MASEYRASIKQAAEYLQDQLHSYKQHHEEFEYPRTLIICGSGLGGISKKLDEHSPPPLSIPYHKIPNFKVSTVPGHSGTLVFGKIQGSPVVLMNGRLHGYEGNSLQDTTFPIRVLYHMGNVKNLVATNAAGGVNQAYSPGDMMCIYDHINFPGFAGNHPLVGPNMDDVGPRFLALSDAYDLDLRRLLFTKYNELHIRRPLHEGTYAFVSGPTFETRAESRLIKLVGGDAVGMSTVPEVIVARHCNWRVLALSLITNSAVIDPPARALQENVKPLDEGKASHAEVLQTGISASSDVESLIAAVVAEL